MRLNFDSVRSALGRSWKSVKADCSLRTCPNTLLMRSLPQTRAGVTVGQLYYCSVDCFVEAAVQRLTQLSVGRVMEMPHKPRLSIGLVMLSKGLLTDSQLRFAVTESQLTGEKLDTALVRLGFADERMLAAARAAQWGCPVLAQDPTGLLVDADVPQTLLDLCSAVPVHFSTTAKRLLLGFVYRVEHSLLHSVEQVTGCRTEACFITPTELAEQRARLVAGPDYKEVVYDEHLSPSLMAKAVGGFALEVGAREASFAPCQDYVWARLTGKRQTIDLLFRGRNSAQTTRGERFVAPAEAYRSAG